MNFPFSAKYCFWLTTIQYFMIKRTHQTQSSNSLVFSLTCSHFVLLNMIIKDPIFLTGYNSYQTFLFIANICWLIKLRTIQIMGYTLSNFWHLMISRKCVVLNCYTFSHSVSLEFSSLKIRRVSLTIELKHLEQGGSLRIKSSDSLPSLAFPFT